MNKKIIILLLALFLLIGGIFFYQQKLKTKYENAPLLEIRETPTQIDVSPNPTLFKKTQPTIPKKEPVSSELILNIEEPQNGTIVNIANIQVKGKTLPNISVFINEKELRTDIQGNFSTSITLEEGENLITVVANDERGNYAEKEITVNLETIE